MNQNVFDGVIDSSPVIVPVFRVTHLSRRLVRLGVAVGDEIARYPEGVWVPLTGQAVGRYNPEMCFGQVKFMEYRDRKTGKVWVLK